MRGSNISNPHTHTHRRARPRPLEGTDFGKREEHKTKKGRSIARPHCRRQLRTRRTQEENGTLGKGKHQKTHTNRLCVCVNVYASKVRRERERESRAFSSAMPKRIVLWSAAVGPNREIPDAGRTRRNNAGHGPASARPAHHSTPNTRTWVGGGGRGVSI